MKDVGIFISANVLEYITSLVIVYATAGLDMQEEQGSFRQGITLKDIGRDKMDETQIPPKSEEEKALWPLQRWLRDNANQIIEPHLNHFKDNLSEISNKITKQNDRMEDVEDMIRKLEERVLSLEKEGE